MPKIYDYSEKTRRNPTTRQRLLCSTHPSRANTECSFALSMTRTTSNESISTITFVVLTQYGSVTNR